MGPTGLGRFVGEFRCIWLSLVNLKVEADAEEGLGYKPQTDVFSGIFFPPEYEVDKMSLRSSCLKLRSLESENARI